MSVVNAVPLLEAAGGGDYTISRSVRLRSSASGYFSKTLTTPTNQKIYTLNFATKRGVLSSGNKIFAACTGGSNDAYIGFNSGDQLYVGSYQGAGTDYAAMTVASFRDPSAWYFVTIAVDTTQAISTDRVKIYVNNVRQTTTSSVNGYWPQNSTCLFNSAVQHNIGLRPTYNDGAYDGYLTEFYFIDGQALTPSSFGTTNATTGVWQPAKYTGTYGTNGFYLNFSSNGTSAALGTDFSGNSNTWTVNNVSVTAGVTYDSMVDSPTVSAVSSNYAVMNPLWPSSYSNGALSNGNLTTVITAISAKNTFATLPLPTTGKYYYELTSAYSGSGMIVGVTATPSGNDPATAGSNVYGYYNANGNKYNNGTASAYGTAWYTSGQTYTIGVAYDADAGTLVFYLNNTSQGTAFTLTTGVSYYPTAGNVSGSGNNTIDWNFGQRPFSYTPPTGFVALNTYNLPASTITNGAAYMAATLYTGTGVSQAINNAVNGVSFQPDLLWYKNRSYAPGASHRLFDSLRGTNALYSNLTNAEANESAYFTSLNSNGFTVTGNDQSSNFSGSTFVGWQWKAGGTSSSNTNGSITSTVSMGATQGFSVVTYTGTGANATVGHGLGVAPSMIIVKDRDTTDVWMVQHTSLGPTKYIILNRTDAEGTLSSAWNNTAPTSTVFSIGTLADVNRNTFKYVAYCFAAVKGFSAFGSYTGNGSSDGPFVYLGFRPRFLLVKRSDTGMSTANWRIQDSSRDPYNQTSHSLYPNLSNAEAASDSINFDFLSNGFKARSADSESNASGGTYIYAAFAESPFKTSLAR